MTAAPARTTQAATVRRQDFRHIDRLRVRWAEVDMQKIVFNGHYLMYLDTAVAGWWRALALPYEATMAQQGGDMYLRKASLDYLASARYDDLIDVGIKTERIGSSSIALSGAVFRGDQLLVSGELLYVYADPATQTSRPVPQALRDVFLGFEAGQPMVELRLGDWPALGAEAGALRSEVFVREQKIPAELEWDAADASALHAVAFNRFGLALATGRLLPANLGVSQLGRMAVLAAMRSGGIGRAVLDALVTAARRRGDTQVQLHAQASALNFYRRAGFEPQGEAFVEAGIAHQSMVMSL